MLTQDQEIKLIEGCLSGNRKSQEILFKTYSRKMYAICLSYSKNEDVAKDIIQDGFIKVFANIDRYVRDSSLEKWIKKIIINTAIDYYRKGLKTIWLRAEYIDEIYPSVQEDILSRINEKELLEMIRSLPAGYKIVFNLFAIEGYSHNEISDMLGISEGTSKSQLFHAKRILKQKINELYGEASFVSNTKAFVINGQEFYTLVSA